MKNKNKKYITLKEAAKISDYSPDYIGQLIRKGKIPGKQIYTSVSWVTTEEDILEYAEKISRSKQERTSPTEELLGKLQQAGRRIALDAKLSKIFRSSLYATIGALAMFVIFLFYVFSVSIDEKIEERASKDNHAENIIEDHLKASGVEGF